MDVCRERSTRDAELLRESLGPVPEPVAKPALIIISGLPGTGKSYFSRRLAERLPLVILESDFLRRQLFPTPNYTDWENQRLFQAIHCLIQRLLKHGVTVLFDATNLIEYFREYVYHIAEQVMAKLIIVRIKAPPGLVRERLLGRAARLDPLDLSEASWEIYEKMKAKEEPIRRPHYVVDTSKDITPVIERVVKELKRE